jgi:hypothetical protein
VDGLARAEPAAGADAGLRGRGAGSVPGGLIRVGGT